MKIQIEPTDIVSGFSLVPMGAIIMWSGSFESIPQGWKLCDGTNGTPDLRNRFIVAAAFEENGIPMTNILGQNTRSGGNIAHGHTVNDPQHSHNVTGQSLDGGNIIIDSSPNGQFAVTPVDATAETNSTGITVGNASTAPPFFALAFIMKVA